MDQIPSQSISKSILLVTPLFLLVLAVLHSSSQLSYLFILKFINNVAGSPDITFLPTTQPQIPHTQFNKQLLFKQYGIKNNEQDMLETSTTNVKNIPLIDIKMLQKWAKKYQIVRGVSPRWLVPVKVGIVDCVMIVVDVGKEVQIGVIANGTVPRLDKEEVAVELQLSHKLGVQPGDVVSINFKPKNIPSGLKLFQKFQPESSDQQYKIQDEDANQQQFSQMLYTLISQYSGNRSIDQAQFKKIFKILYESQANVDYSVKKTYYPQGIYPSALSNVILVEKEGFYQIVAKWMAETIIKINQEIVDVQKLLPQQYRKFWPKNRLQIQAATVLSKTQASQFLQNYSMVAIASLRNRQQIYHPKKSPSYTKFTQLLSQTPNNTYLIVIYPFFQQSLAIKYFFDSVIQIFEFVTCIIYFYTMTLIMKQIYEEKEVEVGIWRTLGAGAVVKREDKGKGDMEIQMVEGTGGRRKIGAYRSQFQENMGIKRKLSFYWELLVKVGYIYYWLATTAVSILLYVILKLIFYNLICTKLSFTPISQPYLNLPILFTLILTFILILLYQHIHRIYTNPLSQTIKPIKRTFDIVKVRVIHIATFGISMQVMLIAVMLVYYGVVSYYWIPYAVLDGQDDLQVLLFNTIFLFMIFGAIMLLSILQSKIQIGILRVLFLVNKPLKRMQSALTKNIKAKQYKNIKVSIIISIIFAFVLFFTAGIKIEMQIVQSFIQRALGSQLVFENYQRKSFNTTAIQEILDARQGIQYSWLSKGLSRGNISIQLISHISGRKLTPEVQVLSPSYLNSTFYQYYYPQQYLPQSTEYTKLPNKVYDGFNSIYGGPFHNESVGKFNENDTQTDLDPYQISVNYVGKNNFTVLNSICPKEQVIKLVVSAGLRKELGIQVGDYYKVRLLNRPNGLRYLTRAQIVHSFKAGPGFDLLGRKAFVSQQQAQFICSILQVNSSLAKQNQKLFIKGNAEQLKGIGSAIIPISPQHTQMFQIQFVSKSFSLLSTYLNAYIVLITCIMSALVTIFIFLYTMGKCREQAQMYKMLRAIGLSAANIRVMVYVQIIIRLIVSICNGVLLGVLFSIGFSLQIEEFLMIKTPPMDITIVSVIGLVLIVIFSITIMRATKYLSQRSVAETTKV